MIPQDAQRVFTRQSICFDKIPPDVPASRRQRSEKPLPSGCRSLERGGFARFRRKCIRCAPYGPRTPGGRSNKIRWPGVINESEKRDEKGRKPMQPLPWHPPVELSEQEAQIVKRIRRAKLFVFLRSHRHEL